jgi:hypothetical protein
MPISEIARSASSQAAVDNQRRTMFFSFVERALFITIDARTMATPFREIPNERHPAAAANPLPGRTTLKRLAAAIVAGCSLAATPALAQQVERYGITRQAVHRRKQTALRRLEQEVAA